RRRVRNHTVVVGYGTKGRTAVDAMLGDGVPPSEIVVVDTDPVVLETAAGQGLVTVQGSATKSDVLRLAGVQHAAAIIVAANRVRTGGGWIATVGRVPLFYYVAHLYLIHAMAIAVATAQGYGAMLEFPVFYNNFVTLSAREIAPRAKIVAAIRESENTHLLRQSGADSVVISSETAGRLLGIATTTPSVVEMIEDLLTPEAGFAIAERDVEPNEVGGSPRHLSDIVLGVVRDGRLLRVGSPEVDAVEADDKLLYIRRVSG
ncbi:MAG: NAD-binding protein, partial [Rhodococcus ruber]|nr:NAD-binding protein [Rhodococcus ruber]